MSTIIALLLLTLMQKDVRAGLSQDFLAFRVQKGMFLMDLEGSKYIHPMVLPNSGETPLSVDPRSNRLFVRCCGSRISAYDIQNDTLTNEVWTGVQRAGQAGPYIKGGDYDYVNGLLFVTDYNRGRIIAFTSALTKQWTVLTDLKNPYAIAVDPVSRQIFWSSTYRKTISKSFLDGRKEKVIIDTDLDWVVAIAIDQKSHRLFWVDFIRERIESSDLEGQDRRVVLTAEGHKIRGMAVDEEFVYYTSYANNNVFRANKLDGSGVKQLGELGSEYYDDGTQVDGMVIRKESLIIKGNSSCNRDNGGCPYLCFPTPEGHTCAGPNGFYTVLPQTTTATTTTTVTTTTTTSTTTTKATPTETPSTSVTTPTTTSSSSTPSTTETTPSSTTEVASTISSASTLSKAHPESNSSTLKSPTTTTLSSTISVTPIAIDNNNSADVTSSAIDDNISGDTVPKAGVSQSIKESPTWRIVAGVFISFGSVVFAGLLVWFFICKRRRDKPVKLVDNPAYITRGLHSTAPPPYDEVDELYSEIPNYHHRNEDNDLDHKYAYVDERKYYNTGSNGYYNSNNGSNAEMQKTEGQKMTDEGYEVPVSSDGSVYADMQSKSDISQRVESTLSDEPESQDYEKFDGQTLLVKDDTSDTYAVAPSMVKIFEEPKEHNYMNTFKKGQGQMDDLQLEMKVIASDPHYEDYEIPISHDYRNVLPL